MRSILALCALLLAPGFAFSQEPPSAPPVDWGPMSINLEDVPYPHPVHYLSFNLEGQDVRMAYMDVAPSGTPNGKSVVLLHGMNFFGEAWTETIAILSKEGYRVIVPDQIGFGRSSKPILHYSISMHAANTKRLIDHVAIKNTDIVTHSMGGMVASRFASSYPEAVGNLAMINQIGLTDARATRPWRDTAEAYKAALARDYGEIVKGMRAYYVTWKPEYMKYVKIHYGWTRSGDWPHMAMVRALQQCHVDILARDVLDRPVGSLRQYQCISGVGDRAARYRHDDSRRIGLDRNRVVWSRQLDRSGHLLAHDEPPFHSINANVPTTRKSINPTAVILTVQSTTNDTYRHTFFMTAAPGKRLTARKEAAPNPLHGRLRFPPQREPAPKVVRSSSWLVPQHSSNCGRE